ncbi:hypothetical protein PUN28_014977 [Cardiocondyla obscurior]|uniref:Uncharacterized protein n=1 Tax=Cardiocondyla obscurior TaxID=286306 RepID=A0AAW2EZH3_9HYME
MHSRIHTRDFYREPLVLRKVCGGGGAERVAGCAGYYLPRTVTNARQRHFHSHPQLPTTTVARRRRRRRRCTVARASCTAAAAYLPRLRARRRRSSQEPET